MILRCCITCWTSGWLKAQPKNWSLFLFHIPVRWSPMGPNSASGFHTGTRRGRWLLRLVRHLPGKRPLPTRRNKKDDWVVWLEKKASAFFCVVMLFSDSNKGLGKTERPGHTKHWSMDFSKLVVAQSGRFLVTLPVLPWSASPNRRYWDVYSI